MGRKWLSWLIELQQVAASIRQHRDGYSSPLRRPLGESDAKSLEARELRFEVARFESGQRNCLLEHRLLERLPAGLALGSRTNSRSPGPSGDTTVSHLYSPTGMSRFFWKPSTS